MYHYRPRARHYVRVHVRQNFLFLLFFTFSPFFLFAAILKNGLGAFLVTWSAYRPSSDVLHITFMVTSESRYAIYAPFCEIL